MKLDHLGRLVGCHKNRVYQKKSRVRIGISSALAGALLVCSVGAHAQQTIQAEDYTAFSDTTAGNTGGQYRADNVDIEATTDSGGGYNVGWIDAGEWLTYNATVSTSGTYTVSYRVASQSGGGSIQLEAAGGGAAFGSINVPSTGGWQSWQTISHSVNLAAGQNIALVAQAGGFNLNWIQISGDGDPQDPDPGTGTSLQAEDYLDFSDTTAGNTGGQHRADDVDIEVTSDTGGGYNVGWIDAGEWLTYDPGVTSSGNYTVSYRVASQSGGGSIQLEASGGSTVYGTIAVPSTGGWQSWQTISHTVNLNAGQQIALVALAGGFNLNWIEITAGGDDPTDPPPPPTGSLPMLQAQGTQWFANGQPQRLRGVNLGNWLQLEMWMMSSAISSNSGVINDQCGLENILTQRFGYGEKERLMDIFRENWMTERDWDNLAAYGFNVVRLPFWHNLVEDENNPYTVRPDAWEWLDYAIQEAAERGIWTILDLHGAAGSQGWEHHSGCANRNWYWNGGNGQPASHYQDRTHWLWDMIAQRYNGNSNVGGYSLLNEPWGTDPAILMNNLAGLHSTIRRIDNEHVIILNGHSDWNGIWNFYAPGPNTAFEMHFYPGFWGWREGVDPTTVHYQWLTNQTPGGPNVVEWENIVNTLNMPFLVGELQPWTALGRNGGEITRMTFDTYNNYGWGATAWSYKTVSTGGHSGNPDNGWPWGVTTNTTGFGGINVSTASIGQIESFFRQFGSMSLVNHPDIIYWMNQQNGPTYPFP